MSCCTKINRYIISSIEKFVKAGRGSPRGQCPPNVGYGYTFILIKPPKGRVKYSKLFFSLIIFVIWSNCTQAV